MALCTGPVLSTIRFLFGTLTFKLRSKFAIQLGSPSTCTTVFIPDLGL